VIYWHFGVSIAKKTPLSACENEILQGINEGHLNYK